MKNVALLILVACSLLLFSNCTKVKERRMSDFEKLTSQTWQLYKSEYLGTEIFFSDTIYYHFYKDGQYIIDDRSESFTTSFPPTRGTWSLSNSTFNMDRNAHKIRSLTTTEFIIEPEGIDGVVYFRSLNY